MNIDDLNSSINKEESHFDKLEGEDNCLEIEAILNNPASKLNLG
jgi:hypothetical protein